MSFWENFWDIFWRFFTASASASPTEEISKAKELLDAGTVSTEELERIKNRVPV